MMTEPNPNARLEAFSDGVFAIALTLLIIEIKIPPGESIHSPNDLWLSLRHLLPEVFAFLLSFITIFITWVNHHATLKLVDKSSSAFIYANGFMLLTVVIVPFPTALLGEYLFTEYAAPAVFLYSAVDALSAVGWILVCSAALKPPRLAKNEKSAVQVDKNKRRGWLGLFFYVLCAIAAFWFPVTVAFLLAAVWIGWLIVGITMKTD